MTLLVCCGAEVEPYSSIAVSILLTLVEVTRSKGARGCEGQWKAVEKHRFGNQEGWATYPSSSIYLLDVSMPQFALLSNVDNAMPLRVVGA